MGKRGELTHTHTLIYSLQNKLVLTAPRMVTIACRLLEVGRGACSFWTQFWYLKDLNLVSMSLYYIFLLFFNLKILYC